MTPPLQSSSEELSSPTRAPGTRQLLLTCFLWVPVCIENDRMIHVVSADYPQTVCGMDSALFYCFQYQTSQCLYHLKQQRIVIHCVILSDLDLLKVLYLKKAGA